MRIEAFCYNSKEELASNTYVLIQGKECLVVDPSCDYDGVIDFIINNNLTPKAILLTHAHYDHIRGVNRFIKRFNLPLYCHELDIPALKDPRLNCSDELNITVDTEAIPVFDNQELNLLKDETIKVIHTPFHTVGSVCYYFKNSKMLISGDTLFKYTIGRDDLITSCPSQKRDSLRKLTLLPKETKVYPGHSQTTTIRDELLFNRLLKREI